MPSIKVPLVLSALLVISAAVGAWWVIRPSSPFTAEQKVNAIISIFACLGGLVSAVFVVFAYWQTSWTTVEASRPQLLVQVVNQRRQVEGDPSRSESITVVQYRNTTANQFADLIVRLRVRAGEMEFELREIFPNPLVMAGQDRRTRWFQPNEVLRSHGFDLREEANAGALIILEPSYAYSFQGHQETVTCQHYRWNAQREEWEIY